ncbi:glycoside hydrolase family 97 protein [Balneolaceae bacterium YR4-1]|uniref:Glycoside hydrolase family 97 protein n=1 Tax=Halalkalibaculum roseum TaxID=2709311 RepID=A0A6M1SMS6_9BACT|nr:glycoside hydrolase family 97 protein [Halalkalibaculum roseum]NGP76641.1 glycoside hydrolase family 97 protein [Halalkalibaculum roseum]
MRNKYIPLLFLLSILIAACSEPHTVSSPDSTIEVSVTLNEGTPYYTVTRNGDPVFNESKMGFELQDAPAIGNNMSWLGSSVEMVDDIWVQPWGEEREIRNRYNELRVSLEEESEAGRQMDIVFRVYDYGFGFRYEWPEQENLQDFVITDEWSEFALAEDGSSWWIPAFGRDRYEYLYENTNVSEIDTVHTPFTVKTNSGLYLSFHEAALVDYASMTLARTGTTTLEADLMPWSDGTKVKTSAPRTTPWRTVQMAEEPGDLLTDYLILNLNEPNKLDDVSWIDPGKYVGIWWEMHLGISTWGSGPNHGATTQNAKRYIDFAAEHGFDGVLVEGWNRGWDGNWLEGGEDFSFTEPYPDFDIEEVADYAREKGTRLIGHHETAGTIYNYEAQMEDAFDLYERLGVRSIKTGYVDFGRDIERITAEGDTVDEWHHGQFMVNHYRRVAETAAEHKIMINAHEPIKDTGLRRTYPNFVTREGARGQEYNSPQGGGNGPEHTTILPFTRMLSGPMDFTPGTFDLSDESEPANKVQTTLAKQLALYVVIYSPLQMASDLPQNYEAHPEAFQFIKDVSADWDRTEVLHAQIGDFITVARKDRYSEEWFLGSITDEEARTLNAELSFLEGGITYTAEIYADGSEADWDSNPMDIAISTKEVSSDSSLSLVLAPGGGQAVRFVPQE